MAPRTRGSAGIETAEPVVLTGKENWNHRGRLLLIGMMDKLECLQCACDLRDEVVVAERYLKAFEEYIEERFGSDG